MKYVIIEKETGKILSTHENDKKHTAFGGLHGAKHLVDHVIIPNSMAFEYLISPVPSDADGDWALTEDPTKKSNGNKGKQIDSDYSDMVKDSKDHMEAVFGTDNESSAVAYKETWVLMVSDPAYFSGEALTARMAKGGLLEGEALDTDQKVLDYATACLDSVKAYSLWRMKRIELFRNDKKTIEES